MNNNGKIYTDDPLVHYRNSKVKPEVTKHEIEALLTDYGMRNITWHDKTIMFETTFKGHAIPIRKECPLIFDRKTEQIDWTVSMRTLY